MLCHGYVQYILYCGFGNANTSSHRHVHYFSGGQLGKCNLTKSESRMRICLLQRHYTKVFHNMQITELRFVGTGIDINLVKLQH